MKKFYLGLLAAFFVVLSVNSAFSQTTISGKITDTKNGESLAGVNIIVKGKVLGTVTDVNGNFNLKVSDPPPFTLIVSLVGFRSTEVSITNASNPNLNIKLEEQTILGEEVVVSASRV